MADNTDVGQANSLFQFKSDGNNEGYGVNGIAGKKYPEVIGWESTTVGPAGDIQQRLSPQNGVQPTDPEIIAQREPFRVGRFLVKWLKAPTFFHATMVDFLRFIFEDMVKGVSGIPENSLPKIDQQNGAVKATSSFPGIYQESASDLSLKVFETSGMIVRKFLDYWISGISDRKTGVSHMYGKKIRSILPNKAGSVLYVLLGPTCRPEDIEFACMWHECWPTNEKVAHANSDSLGDAGSGTELDVTFAGIFDRGPEIDLLARKVVEGYNLYGQSFLSAALPSYIYKNLLGADLKRSTTSVDPTDRMNNGELGPYDGALENRTALRAQAINDNDGDGGIASSPDGASMLQGAETANELGTIENGIAKNIDYRQKA
jgi:hypothetical protein